MWFVRHRRCQRCQLSAALLLPVRVELLSPASDCQAIWPLSRTKGLVVSSVPSSSNFSTSYYQPKIGSTELQMNLDCASPARQILKMPTMLCTAASSVMVLPPLWWATSRSQYQTPPPSPCSSWTSGTNLMTKTALQPWASSLLGSSIFGKPGQIRKLWTNFGWEQKLKPQSQFLGRQGSRPVQTRCWKWSISVIVDWNKLR